EVVDSPIKSDIALVYDFDTIWSWQIQQESAAFDFTEEVMRLYEPFYNQNQSIDVIRADVDFGNYRVLLLPVMKIIDEQLVERLEAFTANGGTVIFSYRAGVRDRNNNLVLGEQQPGKLSPLLGVKVEEVESLPDGIEIELQTDKGKKGSSKVWRDLIKPFDATGLYHYTDAYRDYAAVTVNTFGKGNAYYIGTGADKEVMQEIANRVADERELNTTQTSAGIEIMERTTEDGSSYLFIMNHNGQEGHYNDVQLAPYACKIVRKSDENA
ncbi:beta-galactosidase, partial [Halomonas sp. MG34]|nr:beta-galactosidase [Halomonas sp. MG34]